MNTNDILNAIRQKQEKKIKEQALREDWISGVFQKKIKDGEMAPSKLLEIWMEMDKKPSLIPYRTFLGQVNGDQWVVLMEQALKKGDYHCVEWLPYIKGDLNFTKNNDLFKCLAEIKGMDSWIAKELAECLIRGGRSWSDICDENGNTAAHHLVCGKFGGGELIKELKKEYWDLKNTANQERPLERCLAIGTEAQFLKALKMAPREQINALNARNKTLLYEALIKGNENIIEALVARGANPCMKTGKFGNGMSVEEFMKTRKSVTPKIRAVLEKAVLDQLVGLNQEQDQKDQEKIQPKTFKL